MTALQQFLKSNSRDYFYIYKFNYKNSMFVFPHDTESARNIIDLAYAEDNQIKIINKTGDINFNNSVPDIIFDGKGNKFIYFSWPMADGRTNEIIEKQRFEIYEIEGLH